MAVKGKAFLLSLFTLISLMILATGTAAWQESLSLTGRVTAQWEVEAPPAELLLEELEPEVSADLNEMEAEERLEDGGMATDDDLYEPPLASKDRPEDVDGDGSQDTEEGEDESEDLRADKDGKNSRDQSDDEGENENKEDESTDEPKIGVDGDADSELAGDSGDVTPAEDRDHEPATEGSSTSKAPQEEETDNTDKAEEPLLSAEDNLDSGAKN